MKTGVTIAALLMSAASAHAADNAHQHHQDHHAAPKAAAASSAELPMAAAEVRKVDVKGGKLTLRHERLENLNMAPMTMVFAVKDSAWLDSVKAGDKVRIAVDRVNGALTVVALQKAQ